jgi:hypothetical protein
MNFTKFLSALLFAAFVLCFSSSEASAQEISITISPTKAIFRDANFSYDLSEKDFANTSSWD